MWITFSNESNSVNKIEREDFIMNNMPELKIGVVACEQRLFPGESFREQKKSIDRCLHKEIR